MSKEMEYHPISYEMSMGGSLTLCPYGEKDAKGFPLHAGDYACTQCKYNHMMDYSNKVVFCKHKKKKAMDIDFAKYKVKESLDYLDGTEGLTYSDDVSLCEIKKLLHQALNVLEEE